MSKDMSEMIGQRNMSENEQNLKYITPHWWPGRMTPLTKRAPPAKMAPLVKIGVKVPSKVPNEGGYCRSENTTTPGIYILRIYPVLLVKIQQHTEQEKN